jgi:hypothetical protein
MSDITAIVLTIGEETTDCAIDSLKRQTVLPEEIIVIRNVTPFHKALNLGVSKVRAEFFIQVDADMILDENCLEDLRERMTENVGIAMGQLRDPLMGIESGIKMFRKECFQEIQFKNSVSPDTDFYNDIQKNGWEIRHVLNLKYKGESKNLWPTFGDHKPHYTPIFTYRRYYLLGRRYRYRKDLFMLKRRFQQLQNSNHPVSLVAQIALAHGIFSEDEIDLLMPSLYTSNEDFSFLEKSLRSENSYDIDKSNISLHLTSRPKEIFRNFYNLGIDLRKNNSPVALKYCMEVLDIDRTYFAWIAKVGLCHGIFSEAYSEEKVKREYAILRELL